jgi:hypothetical protein
MTADPFEGNRDRQLEFWAGLPASRRVAWLEEAVDAALRSGALPRTGGREFELPPLTGGARVVESATRARDEALSRLSSFFRGSVPWGVDPTSFAECGALAQFALWRETDASFWSANAEADPMQLIALAAERDPRIARICR